MSEERAAPVAKGQGSNPAQPNFVPGVPSNFNPVHIDGFTGGVNTLVGRAAVPDHQLAWCDGFMPLGADSLRVMPDFDPQPIYTASPGVKVIWYGFVNLQNTYFCIILRSDGGVDAANLGAPFVVTTVLPPGTIISLGALTSTFRVSQWEAMYGLMVSSQPNGYWIWDGTNVFTAGTVGPIVTLTDPGTDPALSQNVYIGFPQSTGSITTVANAHPVFDSNGVSQVIIDSISDTSIPQGSVILVGFGPSGGGMSTAFGSTNIADGVITSASLTDGGSGYTSVPTVNISDPTGSGASIVVDGASGGILTSLKVVAGGSNYTNPSLSFSGGGGTNAAATATTSNGVIQSVNPWSHGNGYTGTPTISFVGDTGSGAVGTPLLNSGQVTGVNVTSGGTNYTNPTYYIAQDGNGPAAATADLMPFGVSGTAIEVYKSRVWISNGRAFVNAQPAPGRTLFSAAGSVTNFGGDGGAFKATDSFTRIGYTQLIQSNGFLWLIADNSLEYISNISTNSVGTPPAPVTTFSVLNADPMTGSNWPSSVYAYGRNLVMSNLKGMFLSSGGAVTKISEGLDGIWHTNDVILSNGSIDFSGGIATIFGRDCYCILLPLMNRATGMLDNFIMMWDGRRCFTAHQTLNLTFIASLNANSYSFLYGTDGNSIHRLFAVSSPSVTKTIISKLYSNPSYWTTKTENEFHALITIWAAVQPIHVSIDSEVGQGTGNASLTLTIVATNFPETFIIGPQPVGQQGRLMGVTLSTTSADLEINSMMIQERIETLNI